MHRLEELARLDAALLGLRRFVEVPAAVRRVAILRCGGDQVQFSTVLVADAVARIGAAGDCSIGKVSSALQVEHSTASRLVERAVRAGMLHKERSSNDPRRAHLSLTAAGRSLQREAVGFRTGRLDGLLSDWPAADVTTFTRLMERFTHAAYPFPEETP